MPQGGIPIPPAELVVGPLGGELEEGLFENGSWQRDRRLNGDEAASLLIEAPVLLRVKVYTYDDK